MAKERTVNPADAHRKSLRKKEMNKNKTDRKKAREVAVVKKDTRSLEADIRKISSSGQHGQLSAADKADLAALRAELASIQKAKADYVEAHPEHRKFVYPEENAEASTSKLQPTISGPTTGLYGPDGRLKFPERSVYYDPVFNPYGAPPPGMPYREKPPTPEELAAFQAQFAPILISNAPESESSDESSDDDIEMPDGPPPDSDDSPSDDSDDDIALPPGPPPIKSGSELHTARVDISRPRFAPGPPPGQPIPRHYPQPMHHNPQMRPGHFQQQNYHQQQYPMHQQLPPSSAGLPSRPHFQQQQQQLFQQQQHQQQSQPASLPTGPQQSLPSSSSSAASISADPSTFSGLPTVAALPSAAGATISAAPKLRDFKAEVVVFVPNVVKRKKAVVIAGGTVAAINAAPSSSSSSMAASREDEEDARVEMVEPRIERASLMGALKDMGVVGGPSRNAAVKSSKNKDYDQFLKNVGGML